MKIKGLTTFSLVDWDGEVCSTIFVGECNFRCPYCQNAPLVICPRKFETLPLVDVIQTIEGFRNYITGVCISGGEPTLDNGVVDLICNIPPGLKIKLDTNGTNPHILHSVLMGVDYVAMDIKAPLTLPKYSQAIGLKVDFETLVRIAASIDIIKKYAKDYEFRTTVVPGIHTIKDIEQICKYAIKGTKKYVIQNFWTGGELINPKFYDIKPFSQAELEAFAEVARKYVKEVKIRNLNQNA